MRNKLFIASLVGIVLGILSAQVLLIGWWSILIWGLVGAIIGYFLQGKREIMWPGICFGFFLSMAFLIAGFQGASDKLMPFLLFSLALSIPGAFGGWFSVFVGSKVRRGRAKQ